MMQASTGDERFGAGPITAIVPMRAGSRRLPGKNTRDMLGRPLFFWVLEALLACPRIERIVLDTDDEQAIDRCADAFPSVRIRRRDPLLARDRSSMNDVLQAAVGEIAGDSFIQTHATNPLLTPQTISLACDSLATDGRADSLFAVTKVQARLYTGAGEPINHDPTRLVPTQDLAPVFIENSALYGFTRASLNRSGARIGANPIMFEIDPMEATDIDDEHDWRLAETLMRGRHSQQSVTGGVR
jgi:CMP-N-acetylneuraminic acid synthetase